MDQTESLRHHLRELLLGAKAHLDFNKATDNMPVELRGSKLAGVPYSPWRLVEHMRIAQSDILEYCRNPAHESPPWPEGYWTDGDSPPDDLAWDQSLARFRADLQAMADLIADPAIDPLAPVVAGKRHTLLREVLLLADHNSYHLGQLVVIRRGLGAWSD